MNEFAKQVAEISGENPQSCYQCGKCSSGCPAMKWFEWPNHGVIRKIQLGAEDELLKSHAIWMCVACETCGSRCPNDIYISRLMDAMRQLALKKGIAPAEPAVTAFHRSFVGSVSRFGRVHELSMLMEYKLKTRDFFTDMGAGLKLMLKGKIPLMPSKLKGKAQVDKIFADGKKS